jgi:hypothetical protein
MIGKSYTIRGFTEDELELIGDESITKIAEDFKEKVISSPTLT